MRTCDQERMAYTPAMEYPTIKVRASESWGSLVGVSIILQRSDERCLTNPTAMT